MRSVKIVPMFLLFGLLSSAGHAAVIYDENVSGDLGDVAPFTELALQRGDNTVLGTTHFGADFDMFAFAVPNGEQVGAILYSFALHAAGDVTSAFIRYALRQGNGQFCPCPSQNVDLLGPSPIPLSFVPLDAGVYSLVMEVIGGSSSPWTIDYRIDLLIGVAEPPPVLVLVAAIALCCVVTLRRGGMSHNRQ